MVHPRPPHPPGKQIHTHESKHYFFVLHAWSVIKGEFLPPTYVVRREGNSFTLLVCSHLGGYPYPIMLCNITQNAMGQTARGGYPARSSWEGGTLPGGGGGCPAGWGVPCWGVPCQGGTLPGGAQVGFPPPQPGQDGGVPCRGGGYPVRTTEGVLTTRRAVCLLRSRRRTFLFYNNRNFPKKVCTSKFEDHLFLSVVGPSLISVGSR